jgi:hypothetical protein
MIQDQRGRANRMSDEELLSHYLTRPSYPEPVYVATSSLLTMPRTALSTNLKIPAPIELQSSPELALSKLPVLYHDWDPMRSENRGVNSGVVDYTGFLGKHEDSTTIIYQRPAQGWKKSIAADPKVQLYTNQSSTKELHVDGEGS